MKRLWSLILIGVLLTVMLICTQTVVAEEEESVLDTDSEVIQQIPEAVSMSDDDVEEPEQPAPDEDSTL